MLVLIAVAARTLDTGAARGLKKPLSPRDVLPEGSPFWLPSRDREFHVAAICSPVVIVSAHT